MADEIDTLLISVRADTRAFVADVATMRGAIDGPLADGADRAGRAIESALLRAVRNGKFGFDDLRRVALSAMADIARHSLSAGLSAVSGGQGGGLVSLAGSLLNGLIGLPGRATGGPVSAGQPYLVGERGPEVFVPPTAGRIEPSGAAARSIRITVNVGNAATGQDTQRMAASGRQIAQAVRRAMEAAEG